MPTRSMLELTIGLEIDLEHLPKTYSSMTRAEEYSEIVRSSPITAEIMA